MAGFACVALRLRRNGRLLGGTARGHAEQDCEQQASSHVDTGFEAR